MDPDAQLDRLLPRHPLGDQRVQIGWDVRPPRKLLRRAERMHMGTIVDLSLDGALIEVPASCRHRVDDIITLRFGGVDGRAIIRHVQHDDEDDEIARYGIRWSEATEIRTVVEKAVAVVRGRNAELRGRWEQTRR